MDASTIIDVVFLFVIFVAGFIGGGQLINNRSTSTRDRKLREGLRGTEATAEELKQSITGSSELLNTVGAGLSELQEERRKLAEANSDARETNRKVKAVLRDAERVSRQSDKTIKRIAERLKRIKQLANEVNDSEDF
jgi:chromosome segregation ATPase